jgi:hypothetical protein
MYHLAHDCNPHHLFQAIYNPKHIRWQKGDYELTKRLRPSSADLIVNLDQTSLFVNLGLVKNKLWLLFLVPLLACERVLLEGCCRARPSITTTTPYQRTSIGIDKASRALAEGVPLGVPFSFCALADYSGVSYVTLYCCFYSRLSSK